MDFTDIKEKITSLLEKIRITVIEKIDFLENRFLYKFPAERRRPILLGFGGGIVLLLVVIIIVIGSGGNKSNNANEIAGNVIPSEEFFYPLEPDFLPEFLLEREPRRSWVLDDIRPYWRSPSGQSGAADRFWQDEIKSAVDKIMEGVP